MAENTPDEWNHRTNMTGAPPGRFGSAGRARGPDSSTAPSADPAARLADVTAAQAQRAPGSPGASKRFLLAHLPLILLVTIVVTAAGAMLSWSQTPMYRSTADVVVEPGTTQAATQQAVDMGTEKGIASSGSVIAIASRSLHVPEDQLDNGVSVSVPVDTDLLQIAYSDPNRLEARRRAQGIAEAYVAFRSQSAAQQAKKAKRTATGATTATISAPQAVIVTTASLPKSRSSPNHKLTVIVAVIVGLSLGLGIALARDRMDDRLRGPLDFERQAGTPVLGLIPRLRRRGYGRPPVTIGWPDSVVAEAYRSLRTRVVRVAASREAKTLLVTSPAREEKTTIAANLAVAMAQSGRLVVLVCADLRWGFAHELFGLDNRIGLTSLIDGRTDIVPAVRTTDTRGLLVLPPGPAVHDPSAVLQGPAVQKALHELRNRADFIVVDGPPVLASADSVALADLIEMLLLTGDARRSTRGQVRAAVHELEHAREKLVGCVLDNVGRAVRLPRESRIWRLRHIVPPPAAAPAASSAAARNAVRPSKETAGAAAQHADSDAETDIGPHRTARTNATSGQ